MKRKIATRNFILLSLLVVIALVFTIFRFPIVGSTNIFKGFARSFETGLDFGNGISNVYKLETYDFYKGDNEQALVEAQKITQQLIDNKYHNGVASIVGDDQIKITVPGTSINSGIVLSVLEMKEENTAEGKTIVTGEHIKKAEYKMNGTTHGVYITFTKEGKTAFETLTTIAEGSEDKTIYVFIGKDYENGQSLTISETMSDGFAYISMGTKEAALTYADQLMNARYGINLSTENDADLIHSSLNTYQKAILASIMMIVIFGAIAYLLVKYRQLGLVASFALIIFALLNIITFSLLEGTFRLSLASFIGMAIGYILTFITILIYFERVHNEYKNGKKLLISFKAGYKKVLATIIDIFATIVILSIVAMILAKGGVFLFSLALLVNCLYGAFTTLLVLRWFTSMYLNINPTKANKINFTREEHINEIN